jgi:hypothetical protein
MDCCVLSSREVGRLTHYKFSPNHTEHHHISPQEAIKGVLEEYYNLVDAGDGRYYVTPVKTFFLRRTPSGGRGGIDTVQRVLSNHILELKPIR